jgi:hypothetical protein
MAPVCPLCKGAHPLSRCPGWLGRPKGSSKYSRYRITYVGPAVDCTGRTSEDCRADRALNAEMKRLWNTQKGTP